MDKPQFTNKIKKDLTELERIQSYFYLGDEGTKGFSVPKSEAEIIDASKYLTQTKSSTYDYPLQKRVGII